MYTIFDEIFRSAPKILSLRSTEIYRIFSWSLTKPTVIWETFFILAIGADTKKLILLSLLIISSSEILDQHMLIFADEDLRNWIILVILALYLLKFPIGKSEVKNLLTTFREIWLSVIINLYYWYNDLKIYGWQRRDKYLELH